MHVRKPWEEEEELRYRQTRPSISMSLDDDEEDYPVEVGNSAPGGVALICGCGYLAFLHAVACHIGQEYWAPWVEHCGRGRSCEPSVWARKAWSLCVEGKA